MSYSDFEDSEPSQDKTTSDSEDNTENINTTKNNKSKSKETQSKKEEVKEEVTEEEEDEEMKARRSLHSIMKLGYPCANRSKKWHTNHTTTVKYFSKEKIISVVQANITDFMRMLVWNLDKNLLFFRVGSDFVPFATHTMMKKLEPWTWQSHFEDQFKDIGDYIKKHNMRISMHPDHFVLINSPRTEVVEKSFEDLRYHCDLFKLMGLSSIHKFQIHVGGVYGNKSVAITRFVENYKKLSDDIKSHLVIENDDRSYSLDDCIKISSQCDNKLPILYDTLHHECLNTSGETQRQAFTRAASTWTLARDGVPMIDYSSQEKNEGKRGKHSSTADESHFERVVCQQLMRTVKPKPQSNPKEAKEGEEEEKGKETEWIKFDIMLEIKDKEKSAERCEAILKKYREKYYGKEGTIDDLNEDEKNEEVGCLVEQARESGRDENGNLIKAAKGQKIEGKRGGGVRKPKPKPKSKAKPKTKLAKKETKVSGGRARRLREEGIEKENIVGEVKKRRSTRNNKNLKESSSEDDEEEGKKKPKPIPKKKKSTKTKSKSTDESSEEEEVIPKKRKRITKSKTKTKNPKSSEEEEQEDSESEEEKKPKKKTKKEEVKKEKKEKDKSSEEEEEEEEKKKKPKTRKRTRKQKDSSTEDSEDSEDSEEEKPKPKRRKSK